MARVAHRSFKINPILTAIEMTSTTPSPHEFRVALGRSYTALQSEVKTLVAEQDGRSWFAFAQKEGYHNILLVQDADEQYLQNWIDRSLATDFEHYVICCGDAIEKRALFDQDYVWECDMPIMTVELSSIPDKLKLADNVQLAEAKDRAAISELLGKGFDTTAEAAIAISAGAGHASPNVAGFKIEEDGEIVGHVSISVVGDFVGVWSVAIAEKARRRGYATALLNHALSHALKLGAKHGVLIASAEGANVYERQGWSVIESFPLLVTKDAYAQLPDFDPLINRPWLRLEHGKIAAAILSESIHLHCDIGEDNWHVVPDSLGFALCQSRHYQQVLDFANKVISVGRMTDLMLAGPAAKFAEKLLADISAPKEEGEAGNSEDSTVRPSPLVPDGSMPAMVYDLTKKDDEKLDFKEMPGTTVRGAGVADQKEIGTVISLAFTGNAGREDRVNPYALGAGNPDPNVLSWILEVEVNGEKKIASHICTVMRDHVAHIWGVATPPEHQRKGYSSLLLKKALKYLRDEKGARMGFLIATKAGLPVYTRMGWQTFEEWPEFFFSGTHKPSVKPSETTGSEAPSVPSAEQESH